MLHHKSGMTSRGSFLPNNSGPRFHIKKHLSRYGDFHIKIRPHCLFNGNPCTGKTASLYGDGPTTWRVNYSTMNNYFPEQSSWGQHGAHLGPVGPRWAPYCPHEPCYQGSYTTCHIHQGGRYWELDNSIFNNCRSNVCIMSHKKTTRYTHTDYHTHMYLDFAQIHIYFTYAGID